MKNLICAKLAVMKQVFFANKDLHLKFGKTDYKTFGIQAVIDIIRPAMVAHGLCIAPCRSIIVHHDKLPTQGGSTNRTMVRVQYRLSHESGESEILETIGDACDSADKGGAKLMTAALKAVLLQTFLLQGGHADPDAYSSEQIIGERTADPGASVPPNGGVDMKQVQDAYEKEIASAYEQLPITSDWTAIHNAFWPIVDRRIKEVCKDAASYKPAATRAKKWASLAWINGVCKTAKTLADLGIAETKLDFLAGHKIDDELVPEKWIATVRDRIEKRKKELSSAGESEAMQRFVKLLDSSVIEMNDTFVVSVFDKAFAGVPADKKAEALPLCKSLWLLRLIPMVADAHDDQFVQERINKLKGKLSADNHAALDQAMQAKRLANKARPAATTT